MIINLSHLWIRLQFYTFSTLSSSSSSSKTRIRLQFYTFSTSALSALSWIRLDSSTVLHFQHFSSSTLAVQNHEFVDSSTLSALQQFYTGSSKSWIRRQFYTFSTSSSSSSSSSSWNSSTVLHFQHFKPRRDPKCRGATPPSKKTPSREP